MQPSELILTGLIRDQKNGIARGLPSLCSSNAYVLEAAIRFARAQNVPLLIESTCNQVNQFGGYTGLTPAQFRSYLEDMARGLAFDPERILLGGDHLGPEVWSKEPEESAMQKAVDLVRACVQAGYTKIHLDASMKCATDPAGPLDKAVSAARAAHLCRSAEEAWRSLPAGSPAPRYIIGTEVPVPGGAREKEDGVQVTHPQDAQETIEITRKAFAQAGLDAAWERVIGLVVQPGVEFGDSNLFEYRRDAAAPLKTFIETVDGMVYEAHSTDYQTRASLRAMVEDHFAILKVGPGLTFALRETIYALENIERELAATAGNFALSGVADALEAAMLANPVYWQRYYTGTAEEQRLARRFSLSDRSRYYWPVPSVQQAVDQLVSNLKEHPIPLSLLSEYLPVQYRRVREGRLENHPHALILDGIQRVLEDYASASGYEIEG